MPADPSPVALAEGEASAKAGSFGGFRRSFDRCHGCPAYVARLLRRSRLKPWGSTFRGFSKEERYHTMQAEGQQGTGGGGGRAASLLVWGWRPVL